jgi:hypothetical protein
MKLVREHINERMGFTEDSDPITDLGIGGIDIIKEWNDLNDKLSYEPDESRVEKEWTKLLSDLFIGKYVTGNFHQGNSDSYGGLQHITTRKPIVRIQVMDEEDKGAFALVTIEPGVYRYNIGEGNYIEKDEVWYFVFLKENPGRKIFVLE